MYRLDIAYDLGTWWPIYETPMVAHAPFWNFAAEEWVAGLEMAPVGDTLPVYRATYFGQTAKDYSGPGKGSAAPGKGSPDRVSRVRRTERGVVLDVPEPSAKLNPITAKTNHHVFA